VKSAEKRPPLVKAEATPCEQQNDNSSQTFKRSRYLKTDEWFVRLCALVASVH